MDKNRKGKVINILLVICIIITLLLIVLYFNQSQITTDLIEQEVESINTVGEGLKPVYNAEDIEEVTLSNFLEHKNEFKNAKAKASIKMPSINLELPIFAGLNQTHLLMGAGEQLENMNPGDVGNYILASHRMKTSSKLGFHKIDKLKKGDEIYIKKDDKTFIYKVYLVKYITNSETKYLEDIKDKAILTLYTCQHFSRHGENPNKIVVQAELEKTIVEN